MENFDYQKYLKGGYRVVTRDGEYPEKVQIIAGIISGWINGKYCSWYERGNYDEGVVSPLDLFLVPVPKITGEGMVDRYKAKNESVQSMADKLFEKWSVNYDGQTYLTKDLFTLAVSDLMYKTDEAIVEQLKSVEVTEPIKNNDMKKQWDNLWDNPRPDKDHLLPCPFCGGKPDWVHLVHPSGIPGIQCNSCDFLIKHDRRDKTIFHWNKRLGVEEAKGKGCEHNYVEMEKEGEVWFECTKCNHKTYDKERAHEHIRNAIIVIKGNTVGNPNIDPGLEELHRALIILDALSKS